MTAQLRNLDVEFVSLVDRAAVRNPTNTSEPQRFLLWKREGGATPDPEGGSMKNDELSAALEKAENERDEAVAKTEELEARVAELEKSLEAKPEPVAEEPAEVNKADLDPRVREMLEKAEARAAASEERIAKAEELAKAERDARLTREFVAKAEGLPHIAGTPGEFGAFLKSASEKLSPEEFGLLEQTLASANDQLATGDLFKAFGADGEGSRNGEGELVAKADENRKSGMSRVDALREAARGEAGARYLNSVR